jgi:hypothetical protein
MNGHQARATATGAVLLSLLFGMVNACGGTQAASISSNDGGADATASVDGSANEDASDAGDAAFVDAPADVAVDAAVDASAALSLCDGIFGAAARSFDSCCSPSDKALGPYHTTAGMFETGLRWCGENVSRSLSQGRIQIDPTQTAACEAKITSTLTAKPMCWEAANANRGDEQRARLGPAECTEALVGLQAASQPCAFDYECADGLTCVGWTNSSDGRCDAPPAIGQPCGYAGDGAITDWYPFGIHPACAAGAYCFNTCHPLGAQGDGCMDATQCSSGLECIAGHCSGNG